MKLKKEQEDFIVENIDNTPRGVVQGVVLIGTIIHSHITMGVLWGLVAGFSFVTGDPHLFGYALKEIYLQVWVLLGLLWAIPLLHLRIRIAKDNASPDAKHHTLYLICKRAGLVD